MDDLDKKAIQRVVGRMAQTKTIKIESQNELFDFLGIKRNTRRTGRKAIPMMPVAGPEDMKAMGVKP